MSKKVITGAVIALAAGVAAYIYNRNKNRINEAASDAYNTLDEAINRTEEKVANALS